MERKMLTYSANQPGLNTDEVEVMGNMHDTEETIKVADLMK